MTGSEARIKARKYLIPILITIALLPVLFVISVASGLFGKLPDEAELRKLDSYTAARILASDGELAGLYFVQKRTTAGLDQLPGHLVNALVATEDARFYTHHGFDFRAILRVLIKSIILRDKSSGGGSTLSQQLAKNLFPRKNYGLLTLPVAKIRELLIALKLEKIYTKDQLIELYLNTVTFGDSSYGIATASLTFFSKDPGELKVEESALLVGILKASSAYNPRLHPGAALERRNVVLGQMARYGYLEEREMDSLRKLPLELNYMKLDHVSGPAPYFREHIRQELIKILDEVALKTGTEYNLYTDGLTIYTTLNLDIQRAAEEAMKEHFIQFQKAFMKNWAGRQPWRKDVSLASVQISQSQPYQALRERGLDHDRALEAMKVKRPSRIFTWQGVRDTLISPLDSILYHFGMLQSGVVAVDPHTGALLAWVGGDDYEFFKYDHVTARRQTGSTFKPLVYATALEQGIDPCKLYSAETENYEEYGGWAPRNYDENYEGFYSLQGALVHSINTVSVKILMESGIKKTAELASKLGITADLPLYPSLALGSADISLLEMTTAYAAFINQGIPIDPYAIEKITDRNGKIIYQSARPEEKEQAISLSTAEIMTGMLQAVVQRGTAASLRTSWRLDNALAGKTGTTQDQSDGWFIGMTPAIVIGVWTGGDSPVVRFRSSNQGSGAHSALPVFARMVGKMNGKPSLRQYTRGEFSVSPQVVEMLNCQDYSDRKGLRVTSKPLKSDTEMKKPGNAQPQRKKEQEKNFFKKLFGRKNR